MKRILIVEDDVDLGQTVAQMMANMNGWEFRERQLADPLWARIPVVVLTAVSDLVSATIEASEVLKKPVSLDEVLSTIRRHAGGA